MTFQPSVAFMKSPTWCSDLFLLLAWILTIEFIHSNTPRRASLTQHYSACKPLVTASTFPKIFPFTPSRKTWNPRLLLSLDRAVDQGHPAFHFQLTRAGSEPPKDSIIVNWMFLAIQSVPRGRKRNRKLPPLLRMSRSGCLAWHFSSTVRSFE